MIMMVVIVIMPMLGMMLTVDVGYPISKIHRSHTDLQRLSRTDAFRARG
jgi:hypothetical protein